MLIETAAKNGPSIQSNIILVVAIDTAFCVQAQRRPGTTNTSRSPQTLPQVNELMKSRLLASLYPLTLS